MERRLAGGKGEEIDFQMVSHSFREGEGGGRARRGGGEIDLQMVSHSFQGSQRWGGEKGLEKVS